MTALQDARHHLAKAKEFLASAEDNRDLERYNAATSDAVISGINSTSHAHLRSVSHRAPTAPWIPDIAWINQVVREALVQIF